MFFVYQNYIQHKVTQGKYHTVIVENLENASVYTTTVFLFYLLNPTNTLKSYETEKLNFNYELKQLLKTGKLNLMSGIQTQQLYKHG